MKLGLLGGSFNPIHHGHLVIATRAAEALKLDRVLFIPAATSPLKRGREFASPGDRWAMVRLALRGNPLFEADDLELRRGGLSYTVDTLRELGLRSPSADLHLILGADATRLLPRWKALDEVRKRVTFVVISRPGHRIRGEMAKYCHVDSPLLEISSSEIRERARKGLSLRYLVPEAVERYVRKKGLYR